MLNPESRRVVRQIADTATAERLCAATRWINWPRYQGVTAEALIVWHLDDEAKQAAA